jgi:hypothetical protein
MIVFLADADPVPSIKTQKCTFCATSMKIEGFTRNADMAIRSLQSEIEELGERIDTLGGEPVPFRANNRFKH